jgi:Cu(I)/Ag(I) efflux system membrane protein CusA/SilA
MDKAVRIPGCVNAWTMPIKGRIDMLSTGVRTTIGIKVFGRTLSDIEKAGGQIEAVLTGLPNTRGAFAERAEGGYFVDIVPDRDRLARHGVTLEDLQSVVMTAMGGETVTTTIEGRERFSVNVRYARDFRSDVDELERVLVATADGHNVPIGSLADIELRSGPAMIRDENGSLAGYVYVDVVGSDVGGYVETAKRAVAEKVTLPTGCTRTCCGCGKG